MRQRDREERKLGDTRLFRLGPVLSIVIDQSASHFPFLSELPEQCRRGAANFRQIDYEHDYTPRYAEQGSEGRISSTSRRRRREYLTV